MIDLDTRLLSYIVWGLGVVVVYGFVLRKRYGFYQTHRNPFTRRRVISAFALFIVAACSSSAIFAVLFGPLGTGIRGFLVAMALGTFLGAGIVMAGESADQPMNRGPEV